jgi:beta-glucosidase
LNERLAVDPRNGRRWSSRRWRPVDLTSTLNQATPGEWRSVKVKLSCFRDAGADVSKMSEPFVLNTSGRLRPSLTTVQLSSDPAGAICPPR